MVRAWEKKGVNRAQYLFLCMGRNVVDCGDIVDSITFSTFTLEMFGKIFTQIFDSSIAENYRHRHVFMDLIVLADSDGVIDMTMEAIARRTNVPVEQIREAIEALSAPDPSSRTGEEDGRRLLPIDERRAWGWQIVNYHHYRKIRDEESRREYHREYKREKREAARVKMKTKRAAGTKRQKSPNGYTPRHMLAPPGEDTGKSYDQYHAGEI